MARHQFKQAIVVGASSGIGAEIAKELARAGAHVALLARREEALEAVAAEIRAAGGKADVYVHDVTDFDAVPLLFDQVITALGGCDLLVYAAGVMPEIEEHEYAFEKDRFMVDVNLLGAMAWMNPAAAFMEAQKSGVLMGISSIAGERGRRQNPAYCTSKAAFTTYLESLRNRLHRYGVDVVTIKPGFVDTRMTAGRDDLLWLISPAKAATLSLRKARRGPKSAFVPGRWALLLFIIRNIPSFVFRKLNV